MSVRKLIANGSALAIWWYSVSLQPEPKMSKNNKIENMYKSLAIFLGWS
jgi:hypothetical protein